MGAQGAQGPIGVQGSTGSQGSQGPIGVQGSQGPTPVDHVGVRGAGIQVSQAPSYHTNTMVYTGSAFAIGVRDKISYLPGGFWDSSSENHLPNECNSFVFIEVVADLSSLGIGLGKQNVYVPCYFENPEIPEIPEKI
jgi:hypothetical protein